MVSRRTRVASWIFRRDHPSRPKAMICCFFSSFKTFAMLREATYPPAAVNVLDVSSESMAAFQVIMYGRFWVFTEVNLPADVLNAHTVLVVVNPQAGEQLTDPNANRQAQEDVEKALTRWGRFDLVMEARSADLVIAVRRGSGKTVTPTMKGGPIDQRPVILQPQDGSIR